MTPVTASYPARISGIRSQSGGGHSTTTGVAPEPEATLAAGGVRCLGSTCRRSVGPNPPLVTEAGVRLRAGLQGLEIAL